MNIPTQEIIDLFSQLQIDYNFKYSSLKPEQIEIIKNTLEKKSTFVMLPTGYGKSDCFILPSLMLDVIKPEINHISLVISPLRSLMFDQVTKYLSHGITAAAITKRQEMDSPTVCGILNGSYSLVFSSPEAITTDPWRGMLRSSVYKKGLCSITFDEAHCISQWGTDFRPAYRDVQYLRSLTPSDLPYIVMTATANDAMRTDVMQLLSLQMADTVSRTPDRPNIFLSIKHHKGMVLMEELGWLVKDIVDKGYDCDKTIVYCRSINAVANAYEEFMVALGPHARPNGLHGVHDRCIDMYHSSITAESEHRILEGFVLEDSKLRVLFCTIAFGMGIQIPDIRRVIHWGASKSMMSYWQEVGRCGRDGLPATAIMYATPLSIGSAKRTDGDMREWVKCVTTKNEKKNLPCIRETVLAHFHLHGMNDYKACYPKCSKRGCVQCSCASCLCCTNCRSACECVINSQKMNEM